MSVPHGADSSGHYHPLLVDTTGRALIVLDTVSGLVFTVTPDTGAEWTVKPKSGETWAPLQTTPANLTVGDHGYDGAAWRKQGMIWAYKAVYGEQLASDNHAAGVLIKNGSIVPAGEVWRVTRIGINDQLTTTQYAEIRAVIGGAVITIFSIPALLAKAWNITEVDVTLAAGDYIQYYWGATVLNSACWYNAVGYKMGVAM